MYRLASLWPAIFSPTGYGLLMHCSRKQHILSNAWHYYTLSIVHNQRCEFQITCTIGSLSWPQYNMSIVICHHAYSSIYCWGLCTLVPSLTLGAGRRRVTVLASCVCLCVCVSVCLCICYHSRGGIVTLYTRTKLLTALSRYTLHFQLVDFDKNASFRSYGVVATPQALYRLVLHHRGDVTSAT